MLNSILSVISFDWNQCETWHAVIGVSLTSSRSSVLLTCPFFWDMATHYWVIGAWCSNTAWWSHLPGSECRAPITQWRGTISKDNGDLKFNVVKV